MRTPNSQASSRFSSVETKYQEKYFEDSLYRDEALSLLIEPTLTQIIVECAQAPVIGSVLRVKVGQIA